MVAITKFGREEIFSAVKKMYTDVAERPSMGFHFPSGRPICEFLGYPAEQLDAVPATAVESFAGVGYPFISDVIQAGDQVLDVGAGAGTDILIASLLSGAQGKCYGLDMTDAMHEKLRRNVEAMGASNVEPVKGNAEEIPLGDASVDVVTSNGVLNLVPDKPRAFAEIYRVLRSGGRLQVADIVIGKLGEELDESKSNPKLWAECIVGAMEEKDFVAELQKVGFVDVRVHRHQDYFGQSSNESTRDIAKYFGAESITLSAGKA